MHTINIFTYLPLFFDSRVISLLDLLILLKVFIMLCILIQSCWCGSLDQRMVSMSSVLVYWMRTLPNHPSIRRDIWEALLVTTCRVHVLKTYCNCLRSSFHPYRFLKALAYLNLFKPLSFHHELSYFFASYYVHTTMLFVSFLHLLGNTSSDMWWHSL